MSVIRAVIARFIPDKKQTDSLIIFPVGAKKSALTGE
jgi:hypothetical protein